MENTPSQEFKDQVFISTSAWVIVVFSFIILYFACFQWLSFQKIAALQESMFQGTEAIEHDLIAKKQQGEALLNIILTSSTVGAFLLLITSINLLRRRKSGRILFTITTGILLTLLLFFIFYLRKNYQQQLLSFPDFSSVNEGLTSHFGEVARLRFLGIGIFCIILAWALVRITIKMNSKRIRSYFS